MSDINLDIGHKDIVIAAGGGGGFTVDVWEKLETIPNSGSWEEIDTQGKLTAETAGELATLSQFNAGSDTGTYGAQFDRTATAPAYIRYTNAANITVSSIGFWFKVSAWANWDVEVFLKVTDGTANLVGRIKVYKDAGPVYLTFVDSPSGDIEISVATWYWVTVQFNSNGTNYMRVYNTSGSQVGSQISNTGGNYYHNWTDLGLLAAPSATNYIYIDDIVIDYTDGTFPLGP